MQRIRENGCHPPDNNNLGQPGADAWRLAGAGADVHVHRSRGLVAGAPVIPPLPSTSLRTVPNPVIPKDLKTGNWNKNQLNPGPASTFVAGPNFQLTSAQFPISPTRDDIVGSRGVRASNFLGINSKTGAESTTSPTGFRQVTGKNTPPTVNAVFNHRDFWNGGAQAEFDGVNPNLLKPWALASTGTGRCTPGISRRRNAQKGAHHRTAVSTPQGRQGQS